MLTEIQLALIETGFIQDPRLITPSQFKAQLIANGKTIKEWANEHGYKPTQVSQVLSGSRKGTRGLGHEIAVALGIKLNPQR